MEGAAEDALREAERRLSDQLYMVRNAALLPNRRIVAPAVWDGLRAAMGQILDIGAEMIESARYWAQPPAPPGTSADSGPSTSREPTLAECPICFGLATRVLRPCGHILCDRCVVRVGRCPICKMGFSHSLEIYFP